MLPGWKKRHAEQRAPPSEERATAQETHGRWRWSVQTPKQQPDSWNRPQSVWGDLCHLWTFRESESMHTLDGRELAFPVHLKRINGQTWTLGGALSLNSFKTLITQNYLFYYYHYYYINYYLCLLYLFLFTFFWLFLLWSVPEVMSVRKDFPFVPTWECLETQCRSTLRTLLVAALRMMNSLSHVLSELLNPERKETIIRANHPISFLH